MPEAISNEALGRFTPLQLAGKTRCQPCGISPGFSDDCAGDAAAQPCVHAGHNNSFRGQSAGRGGVRNSLHNFWRSADLNVHHNDSPDPGNRRDCLHGGVRDIRYAGRHDDPAPKRVARQRPSTALPCQILLFHLTLLDSHAHFSDPSSRTITVLLNTGRTIFVGFGVRCPSSLHPIGPRSTSGLRLPP